MNIADMPKGIDISKWQATTPSLAGLDFLIARASIGTQKDEEYDEHIRNARAAGLLTGAYHFNWSTIPVSDQIEAFLRAAGDVDFYFLDVEYAGNGVRQFTRAESRDFIRGVRLAKGSCGLYMSQSGYYTDVDNDYRWVARWGTIPPSIPWKFWQYQGSPLDKNRFNGTEAELAALAGSAGEPDVAQKEITQTEPKLIRIIAGQDIFDLDGKTKLMDNPTERTDVFSPVQRGTITIDGEPKRLREWYTSVNGVTRSVLCRVDDSNIKPIPAPVDNTPYSAADVAAAEAAAEAKGREDQKSADQAAIDAANAAAAAATAELDIAEEKERERIAQVLGEEEANRVRATAP